MCGINGSTLYKNKVILANQTLKHRGPDYSEIYQDKNISLGHTLLSIRGTIENSKQPIYENETPWVMAFNGQIYNTDYIAKILNIKKILNHKSDVDSYLLFKLICQFGWEFINFIQGMYSIALYNKHEEVIKIYRDHSGQKNLYYSYDNKVFAFSSEIKSLKLLSNFPYSNNNSSVNSASMFGYFHGRETLVKNVYKLLPGEHVSYDIKKKKFFKSFIPQKYSDYPEELNPREVIQDTIRKHMLGRHSPAINLSGGIDSSIIYHEMCNQGFKPISYSTFFLIKKGRNNKLNEDAILAKKMAKERNGDHREIEITSDDYLENFVKAYETIEEPNYNMGIPVYYYLANIQGDKGDRRRVVLSGDGGDEVFGGYHHYLKSRIYDKLTKFGLRKFLEIYKLKNSYNMLNYNYDFDRWFSSRGWNPGFNVLSRREKLQNIKLANESFLAYKSLFKDNRDPVYGSMMVDRFFWLANENFIRSDKIFMNNSIELRCPFAYLPLREYFDKKVPSNQYINKNNNKLFIRKIYESDLPSYILNKQNKTGWTSPISSDWYDEKTKELFVDIIDNYTNPDSSVVNWKDLRGLIANSMEHPGKHAHFYLSLAITSKALGIDI